MVLGLTQMTSLDNHQSHDGCCVHSSSAIGVLEIGDYYDMDDFAEEGGFQCEGGDDIMVEVLGSDVYVDGICGDENGGDRCFSAGLVGDSEFDAKSWSRGDFSGSIKGLERRRQALETRASYGIDDSSPSSDKEGLNPHSTDRSRKERSLAELTAVPEEILGGASPWKRHKVDNPSLVIEDVEKASTTAEDTTSSTKPSGSLESKGERSENGDCALLNGFEIFISESGEVEFPLLEQLQFTTGNPLEGQEEPVLRNSKPSDIYQLEDANDSYWTDRVIATNPTNPQYYEYEGETMIGDSRRLDKTDDRLLSTTKESSSLEGDCLPVDDNTPAELILIFPKTGSFPVAATLNKTLKMFGPLKELETQVDRKSNRARVVFRKFGDAKVAFSSAQKYSIFGPLDVKYQLNHPISDP